jgi:hypothetical protein
MLGSRRELCRWLTTECSTAERCITAVIEKMLDLRFPQRYVLLGCNAVCLEEALRHGHGRTVSQARNQYEFLPGLNWPICSLIIHSLFAIFAAYFFWNTRIFSIIFKYYVRLKRELFRTLTEWLFTHAPGKTSLYMIDLKGFWRWCMLYRAIGLVLDSVHRLVCGRQKTTTFRRLDLSPSSGGWGTINLSWAR